MSTTLLKKRQVVTDEVIQKNHARLYDFLLFQIESIYRDEKKFSHVDMIIHMMLFLDQLIKKAETKNEFQSRIKILQQVKKTLRNYLDEVWYDFRTQESRLEKAKVFSSIYIEDLEFQKTESVQNLADVQVLFHAFLKDVQLFLRDIYVTPFSHL